MYTEYTPNESRRKKQNAIAETVMVITEAVIAFPCFLGKYLPRNWKRGFNVPDLSSSI